ncbi:hypothetical protein BCR44DRAFT_39429, partial [Catenaria anguillulae PL171]
MESEHHVLSDAETYNSIVMWALSGICSLALGFQLIRRALGHVLTDNSSLLLMMKGRARLMLLMSALIVVDSINNIYHFYWIWLTDEYMVTSHRMVLILSSSPCIALVVMIIFYRCAMVLVSDSAWRRYYLHSSRIICVVAWLIHAAGGYVAMREAAHIPATEAVHGKWYPSWATALLVPVPMFSIAASIWSIHVAARRHNQTFRTRQVTPDSRTAAGMHKMTTAGVRKSVGAQQAPTTLPGPPPGGFPNPTLLSSSPVPGTASSLLAPPPALHTEAEDHHRNSNKSNQFPLSRTFQWLNVVSVGLWITVAVLAFAPRDHLSVHYNALLNFLLMLSLANEYSFGHLIQFLNRRRKRSQRRSNAAAVSDVG